MKGDTTRSTHRSDMHYTRVRKQQGRVDIDADWNEQGDIEDALRRTVAMDTIGPSGAPVRDGAFHVLPMAAPPAKAGQHDLAFSFGRFYAKGILCQNEPRQSLPATVPAGDGHAVALAENQAKALDGRPIAAGDLLELLGNEEVEAGRAGLFVRVKAKGAAGAPIRLDEDASAQRGKPGLRIRRLASHARQPDLPGATTLPAGAKGTRDIVFLDVWERHITAIEDPHIREVALGGPDTATRVKTVWQVRLLRNVGEAKCGFDRPGGAAPDAWKRLVKPTDVRLTTGTESTGGIDDPCHVPREGGFRGPENRHYRVEVHDTGHPAGTRPSAIPPAKVTGVDAAERKVTLDAGAYDGTAWRPGQHVELYEPDKPGIVARVRAVANAEGATTLTVDKDLTGLPASGAEARRVATLKWSRDNGAVAYAIVAPLAASAPQADNAVTVARLGRDQVLALRKGDEVEVLGDESELAGVPGALTTVDDLKVALREVILTDTVKNERSDGHAKIRRWDGVFAAATGTAIRLEQGITVKLGGSRFECGQYWNFTARTITGKVQPLTKAPPAGIAHVRIPLSVVEWVEKGGAVRPEASDCRKLFPALTELPDAGADCCAFTVGDGTTHTGDFATIQEAVDQAPNGATVCVLPGVHRLSEPVKVARRRNLVIHGCRLGAHVRNDAGTAAFAIEDCSQVAIRGLRVSAHNTAGAVIAATGGEGITIEDCDVLNTAGEPRLDVPNEGLTDALGLFGVDLSAVDGGEVRCCGIMAQHAIGLRGAMLRAERNRTHGGVWVREPSHRIRIADNLIRGREGAAPAAPAVALGGVLPGDPADRGAKGLNEVVIEDNDISNGTLGGIATMGREGDTPRRGALRHVTVERNRIHKSVFAAPTAPFDPEAVGGIVLQDATAVAIRDNRITHNGAEPALASCGVFLRDCGSAIVEGNLIVGNGTATASASPAGEVDFSHADREKVKAPHEEQEIRFESRDADGRPEGGIWTLENGHTGYGFREALTIAFPAARDIVSLHLAWDNPDRPPTVAAEDANGASHGPWKIPEHDKGEKGLSATFQVPASRIVKVAVKPAMYRDVPENVLVGVRWDSGAPTWQVGIGAIGTLQLAEGFKTFTGKNGSDPGSDGPHGWGARVPGLVVRDNTVVCPMGHALFVDGVGRTLVEGNELHSQGMRPQPRESPGQCVVVRNLSQDPDDRVSRELGRYLQDARPREVDGEGWAPPDAKDQPHLAIEDLQEVRHGMPEARVLIMGNRVTLQARHPENSRAGAAVAVASYDDVAVQDNQFLAAIGRAPLDFGVLAVGGSLRVIGNRFAEAEGAVAFSCLSWGIMNMTAANQATHCVAGGGVRNDTRSNQVRLEERCAGKGRPREPADEGKPDLKFSEEDLRVAMLYRMGKAFQPLESKVLTEVQKAELAGAELRYRDAVQEQMRAMVQYEVARHMADPSFLRQRQAFTLGNPVGKGSGDPAANEAPRPNLEKGGQGTGSGPVQDKD